MNQLSAETLIRDEKTADMTKTSRVLLILTAWLGTLLLSRLPQIILSELGLDHTYRLEPVVVGRHGHGTFCAHVWMAGCETAA